MCDKPTVNIMLKLNGERLKVFFLGSRSRMLILTTLIQCCTEIPAKASWQEKEIKLIRIEKEEVKQSLLAYDMILYVDINTLSKNY